MEPSKIINTLETYLLGNIARETKNFLRVFCYGKNHSTGFIPFGLRLIFFSEKGQKYEEKKQKLALATDRLVPKKYIK